MRGLKLNKHDVNSANAFVGGKILDLIARTVIAISDEHAKKGFGEDFLHEVVLKRRPAAAQRRRPRSGVRSQARWHLPLTPRGGRW
jgi:hypothetical protein